MTETRVPSSSRKENASRLTVELYADGQHDERRQEAEPHKQDAWTVEEEHKRRGRGEERRGRMKVVQKPGLCKHRSENPNQPMCRMSSHPKPKLTKSLCAEA